MIKETWNKFIKPKLPKDLIGWLVAIVLLLLVVVTCYIAFGGKQLTYGNGVIALSVPKEPGIAASPLTPGVVTMFSGPASNLPSGWLPCDGSPASSKTFPLLYRAIGQYWGKGDGSLDADGHPKDFNLPDMRGRFVRGVDGGSHNDPDASTRKPIGVGRSDEVATLQGHAFQTHTHPVNDPGHSHPFKPTGGDNWPNGFPSAQGAGGTHPFNATTGPVETAKANITINNAEATGPLAQASTTETRPSNVAIYFAVWTGKQ